MKKRNKIVQEIMQNVANVFSFNAIIAIEHGFFIALTIARSHGRCWGFQHLPRDLANVNAWQTMFDPYIGENFV